VTDVTDARLYSKQPKCVFERDWIDVYFKLLDAHFPGIPFAKNPGSKPATETVEVEFPRDFPRAPLSGKAIGYVACRAVFRDLLSEYLYAWKDDLSDAVSEQKIQMTASVSTMRYNFGMTARSPFNVHPKYCLRRIDLQNIYGISNHLTQGPDPVPAAAIHQVPAVCLTRLSALISPV
jgi:hypothetical protein